MEDIESPAKEHDHKKVYALIKDHGLAAPAGHTATCHTPDLGDSGKGLVKNKNKKPELRNVTCLKKEKKGGRIVREVK